MMVSNKSDSIDSTSLAAAGELVVVCKQIAARGWDQKRWAVTESCDEFQTAHLCGGFDADEMAFCFSLFSDSREEKWFQFTLDEAMRIAGGSPVTLQFREPN